jgi:hypothetical protein
MLSDFLNYCGLLNYLILALSIVSILLQVNGSTSFRDVESCAINGMLFLFFLLTIPNAFVLVN